MAAGGRSGWKIFGIIVIIALIGLLAFLVGRGCERKKGQDTTTTTQTQAPAATPAASPGNGGAAGQPGGDGAATTQAPEDQLPTVVYTENTYGPCIDGSQQVTHYTEYSNGTSASSVSSQPCESEEPPPIEPVP